MVRLRLVGLSMVGVLLASCARGASPEAALPSVSTAPIPTAPTNTSATVLPTSTAPPRGPIVLGFAGDTSFTKGLEQRDPFGDVVSLLQDPDLMVVNLETAVADPGVGLPPVQKQYLFRSPPESLDLLVDAGVDVVALANNHSLDFGSEALAQTLAEIDARSLARVGAGVDQDDAYQPLIVEVGEWRIGLVSMSRVPCDWSASGQNVRPGVAWACPAFQDLADDLVRRAVSESDFAVVMVHGGEEGVLCPSEFMVELEERWASLGVDLIVDGHPHVVQGITSVSAAAGEAMVVHSTGNFAFPSARGITANTAIFEITISEELAAEGLTNGLPGPQQSLRVVPLRAEGGVISRPNSEQFSSIIDQINGVSSGWRLDPEGLAVRDDSHSAAC